jgi:hypothetical protein
LPLWAIIEAKPHEMVVFPTPPLPDTTAIFILESCSRNLAVKPKVVQCTSMSPEKFIEIQEFLGYDRRKMAEILHCSIPAIDSYRTKSDSKKRNLTSLKKKVLIDEFIKAGGDLSRLGNNL